MTLRSELEKVLAMGHNVPTNASVQAYLEATTIFLRDHGPALLEAVADSERLDALELSQRADVYWHENGEQELAGYEWGCGGTHSTCRDALDAVIAWNRRAGDGE